MRTLTLGVLIVSGGTLAALPFRRYQQSIPDASSGPIQATGPTQSSMGESKIEILVEKETADVETLPTVDSLMAHLPPWNRGAVQQQRPRNAPLTYEDLAVPINDPPQIRERFSASVQARESRLDREKQAGLVMPRLESLALDQQNELKSMIVSTEAETPTPSSQATLASASSREASVQPLPKPDPRRQRHWIHQPD